VIYTVIYVDLRPRSIQKPSLPAPLPYAPIPILPPSAVMRLWSYRRLLEPRLASSASTASAGEEPAATMRVILSTMTLRRHQATLWRWVGRQPGPHSFSSSSTAGPQQCPLCTPARRLRPSATVCDRLPPYQSIHWRASGYSRLYRCRLQSKGERGRVVDL
jgi:hypothetical protein